MEPRRCGLRAASFVHVSRHPPIFLLLHTRKVQWCPQPTPAFAAGCKRTVLSEGHETVAQQACLRDHEAAGGAPRKRWTSNGAGRELGLRSFECDKQLDLLAPSGQGKVGDEFQSLSGSRKDVIQWLTEMFIKVCRRCFGICRN
mmetsp:Transcript_68165/g.160446  ORF Transcript_68165/g.160446 Transcript_68165/m.160446 type:complete len:144 (-) Transcript_68165:224-655(-)